VKVLVIAPHMDDEILGCGGTMVRHVQDGDSVSVCIVADRAYGHQHTHELIEREKEACRRAKAVIGYHELIFLDLPDEHLDRSQIALIVPLEEVCNRVKPDIVYLPHRGDVNQDHRAIYDAVLVACRPHASYPVKGLRVYEVPSSSDQAPAAGVWPFLPNLYVDINGVLDRKITALACYETENRAYPHPRSPEGLLVYAKKRGMEVGIQAAEAFVTLRQMWLSP